MHVCCQATIVIYFKFILFIVNSFSLQAITAQPTFTYAVRWAAVSPLSTDAREFTLTLIGGLSTNPDSTLVFAVSSSDESESGKKTAKKSQLVDKISFKFSTPDKVGTG